jgi:pimeloyl-ACP methyl ester carboxylesterase
MPIVLIHGLWFRSTFMRPLARRLEAAGFEVLPFNYHTTREPLQHSAQRLLQFCTDHAAAGAHLAGHSLGGLLLLEMLRQGGWNAPGRLLFMGTPLQGSAVARRVSVWPGMERLLGHAGVSLHGGLSAWPQGREAGMIAGTTPFGLGVFAGGLQRPHDGTVAVAETCHEDLSGRIELPVTHTGMLYSAAVAQAAVRFLHNGSF